MTSKYMPEETDLMMELLFINLIKENKLASEDIVNFTPRLLKLYLDNIDTSQNNKKFRYEIRKDLLSYLIQDNNLEKIEILDEYLDEYVYYYVFDLLHSLNKTLNLSDDLIKFLNKKMKGETLKYIRGKLYDEIYIGESCLSNIYHYN